MGAGYWDRSAGAGSRGDRDFLEFSSDLIFERDFRIRTGASNHTDSSTRCGNFFASSACSTARIDTRGITRMC